MSTHRPLILLGNGIRHSGAAELAPALLGLGVPVIASWQAKDLVDNSHPLFLGCSGLYGNRAANLALYHASEVYAVGNRLAIWNIGYEGLREGQRFQRIDDAEPWLQSPPAMKCSPAWPQLCRRWKTEHPWLEPGTHDDRDGYINSYRFFDRLAQYFAPDEQVALDCGSACASAFQVMSVKPPQRLYSSGGLGEMGCALPAAVGLSFARNKSRVVCIAGDGGMMLNLQELQTIVHHQLPIKIIVASNDGYMMIRKTQKLARQPYAGVNKATGVSCPSLRHVALAFGITAGEIRTWEDFERIIPGMLSCEGPALVEYIMHPEQAIYPKLDPIRDEAGNVSSPRFCDMTPAV